MINFSKKNSPSKTDSEKVPPEQVYSKENAHKSTPHQKGNGNSKENAHKATPHQKGNENSNQTRARSKASKLDQNLAQQKPPNKEAPKQVAPKKEAQKQAPPKKETQKQAPTNK